MGGEWRRAAESIRLSVRGAPLKYINRTVELVEGDVIMSKGE